MGNSEKGKKLCAVIGGYMVIKSAVNLLMGFGVMNIVWLAVNIALAYAILTARPMCNLVTGVFLSLMFLLNVKNNIEGKQWFYLGEGIADAVCAAALFVNKDIKAFFGK